MKRLLIPLLLSLFITACASPEVRYSVVSTPDKSGAPKFQFSDSVLRFDYPIEGSGATAGPNTNKMNITSVPVVWSEKTYNIRGTTALENWGVETQVKATHRNDTKLIQEIGSEVMDRRVETLTAIAAIAATGIGLFASGQITDTIKNELKQKAPSGILLSRFLAQLPSKCTFSDDSEDTKNLRPRDKRIACTKVELEDGFVTNGGSSSPYLADITIGPRPVGAFSKSSITFPHDTKLFLYSACRPIFISITNASMPSFNSSASLVIADPEWFEGLAFPKKGKITVGASCGADSAAEDSKLPGPLDYINALLSGAKAIKDARDAQKKSGVK